MDNLTGDVKGYEKMADNYVEPGSLTKKKKPETEKKDAKLEKEFKNNLAKIIKDYKEIEKSLVKLRELKALKEFYDASTSLDNFKESIQKITMIYN